MSGTDKKFTGQQEEGTALGLYDYGARFYSTALGRFLSPDPLVGYDPGDPQKINRYSYVHNNPLRYTDPTGLMTPEEEARWRKLHDWVDYFHGKGYSDEDTQTAIAYLTRQWRARSSGGYTKLPDYGPNSGPDNGEGGPGMYGPSEPTSDVGFEVVATVRMTSIDGTAVKGDVLIVTYSNSNDWWWGEEEIKLTNGNIGVEVQKDTGWQEWNVGGYKYGNIIRATWSCDISEGTPVSIELEPWDNGGSFLRPILKDMFDWEAYHYDLNPIPSPYKYTLR